MITAYNLNFLEKEKYGIRNLNLSLEPRQRYFILTESEEQSALLIRIMTGMIFPSQGRIEKSSSFFLQTDRMWLEKEKVIDQTPEEWLGFSNSSTFTKQGRRNKYNYLNSLNRLRPWPLPIYRLNGKELLGFTLLSLLFQENGGIILSCLPQMLLDSVTKQLYEELLENSLCMICILSHDPSAIRPTDRVIYLEPL